MRKLVRPVAVAAILGLNLGLAGLPAQAAQNDIVLPTSLSQDTFDKLVDQMGMAIAYNPYAPAETLGITGFDLGLSVSMVEIDQDVWNQVVEDASAPARFPVPRLMVRKGLPFGIDVGASYTKVPSSNVTIVGGEIRKALLDGSAATPAVSVLGHASRLSGVDSLDLSTYGVDLGISKGFAMLTPYAGIGQVWYDGSEQVAALALSDRSSSDTRGYVGLKITFLPIMNLVAQADFSAVNIYTLRLNIGF